MKQPQIKIIGDGKELEGIMAYKWNLFINDEKINNVKSIKLEIVAGEVSQLDIVIGGGNIKVEGNVFANIKSEKE